MAFSIVWLTFREMSQALQRLLEVRDRLLSGGAARRLSCRPDEDSPRPFPTARPERVVRQPLDLLGQTIRIECLDRLHDPGMERAPPLLEQAAVGDLVGERVLEGVFEVGEQARLVEELRRLKLGEAASELVLGQIGDGLEQGERHVLADDRGATGAAACPRARAGRCARPAWPAPWPAPGCSRWAWRADRRPARRRARSSRPASGRSLRGRTDCPPCARSRAA